MEIVGRYNALCDAVQHACLLISQNFDSNASVIFDVDDTLIFDDGHETPNVQIKHLLSVVKAYGYKIHLVTARLNNCENLKWTRDELRRHGIQYDSLALCPKKQRLSMKTVADWKHSERKKHAPVLFTIGDMWGDSILIESEEEMERLDKKHKITKTPWIILSPNDGVSKYGFKIMS